MPFIILDLFGVITLGSYKEICSWISKKYSLDYENVYRVVYHEYFSAAALGEITEAQSFCLAAKDLGLKETGAELRKRHLSFQKLNQSVLRLAKVWQKEGARIVVFSKNTPRQFNEIVRLFGLRQFFPIIINSYNLGLEKKSAEALEYLLKKFKADPRQSLMIDDQEYNFVNAKKIGIKAILYKTPEQLKTDVNSWIRKVKDAEC